MSFFDCQRGAIACIVCMDKVQYGSEAGCRVHGHGTPFSQGNEFFDPSVPDITGRILDCFGLLLAKSDAFYSKNRQKAND
jgi:hypothetical protein